nr:PP2C family serine/threonine-protein phosphatase [uncultured Flavobacterium sp.]
MDETEKYIRALLLGQGIESHERFSALFREFIAQEENTEYVKTIRLLQQEMTKNWQIRARREELKTLQVALPNGNQGKPYAVVFDFDAYGLQDVTTFELSGFEGTGLSFNPETKVIEGIPTEKGDIVLNFTFNFETEEPEAEPNHKKITLIINPDPKLLWKNIPSDPEDIYAKPDAVHETSTMGECNIIVASCRGRSHANRAGFRDDDYAYAKLPNGWYTVAISDGAGSAQYSRKGSAIACAVVIDALKQTFQDTTAVDNAVASANKETALSVASPLLLAAAEKVYNAIDVFATEEGALINDFHTTLSFVVFKQFPDGYAFLSFGVGDCPTALVAKDFSKVTLLNIIDSGDFGGGTRFITMPEVLKPEVVQSRFGFEFTTDLPYLVLMTDGIYDPKFEVEANLANPEKWQQLFESLNGKNDVGTTVPLDGSENAAEKLLAWMDFWSPGNHDDRTLAIVF